MEKKVITELQAQSLMEASGGHIFTAIFTKNNGKLRRMNCRRGVKKGVKGVGLKYNPPEKRLLTVFDMQSNGFRMVNLKTLEALHINKEKYLIA